MTVSLRGLFDEFANKAYIDKKHIPHGVTMTVDEMLGIVNDNDILQKWQSIKGIFDKSHDNSYYICLRYRIGVDRYGYLNYKIYIFLLNPYRNKVKRMYLDRVHPDMCNDVLPICGNHKSYPCRYKNTIFNSYTDQLEYIKMRSRQKSARVPRPVSEYNDNLVSYTNTSKVRFSPDVKTTDGNTKDFIKKLPMIDIDRHYYYESFD